MPNPPTATLRVTLRSLLLGTFGGLAICAFAAFNDWAMNNTFLIGNNMPVGAIMLVFLFVLLVNGPLSRWWPSRAFSSFEIAVAFMIMLTMCALPTSGLIRYLLPNIVMPFHMATENERYKEYLSQLGVSRWVFPDFNGSRPVNWIGDTLATSYNSRWLDPNTSPYGKWITPFLSWGIFVAALFWALICLVCIVLRQWRDNEHLPFPLAQIQLSIIEAPPRGQWLNDLFRKRSFWIAFSAVFLLHVNNGLYVYFPKYFVQITRGYDFQTLLVDPPWNFVDTGFKKTVIYFSVIGVTYFLNSSVAFSLWFFYVLMQVSKMVLGSTGQDAGMPGLTDQSQGVCIAFFLSLMWLGRHHWKLVISQALRGEREGEPVGTYLSYRAAFFGLVGSFVAMVAWLTLAGTTVIGACVIVTVVLISYVLVTRMVAETGLIHGGMRLNAVRPFEFWWYYTGKVVPSDTFYLGNVVQCTLFDYREIVPVYLSHGAVNIDHTKPDLTIAQERRIGRKLLAWLCLSLALGYSVAFFAGLWTQYNYAISMDQIPMTPIDQFGQQDSPRYNVMEPIVNYGVLPEQRFSPAEHFTFGFSAAAVLSYLRLRFAWWPLHPIGYMMVQTFPVAVFWFSIFIGWLLKIVILRVGSVGFYKALRPACIGLLLGESAAAGFWLLTSVVLNSLGMPYRAYFVMPQ